MSERAVIGESSTPRLARGVRLREDQARGRWVLLAPERVLVPDETALEILRRCDGERTVAAIADELAAEYSVPVDEIARDVAGLLQGLADKGFVQT